MPNNQFLLPDVGEGLTEADIVAWHVAVGDTVAINDIICDIETAKSVVELPSPFAGTVQALFVQVGQTVDVGTPIIEIGEEATAGSGAGGAPTAEAPAVDSGARDIGEIDLSNPAASGGGEGESLVGRMKADRGPQRRRRRGSATPRTEAGANTQMQVQGAFSPGGALSEPVAESEEKPVPAVPADVEKPAPVAAKALAKPKVRRIARDLGVDLAAVSATGPHGTVTAEDVLAFTRAGTSAEQAPSEQAPSASESPVAPAPASGVRATDVTDPGTAGRPGEVREPVKGVRKAMAQAMTSSAFTAPHVTEWLTVDVTETVKLVAELKQKREFSGVRVTSMLLVAKACLLAMRRTPIINSWFDAAAGADGEVVHRSGVNLGIAAATPRGLMVPNIKGADALDLRGLALALGELVSVAKEGRTQPGDMAGGTFTITNVGVFGVDAGTPIINPGESAILAVGAFNRRPWVVTDKKGRERLEIRDVATLAVSFDHRHIDGEAGSKFLADVGAVLSDPVSGLLM